MKKLYFQWFLGMFLAILLAIILFVPFANSDEHMILMENSDCMGLSTQDIMKLQADLEKCREEVKRLKGLENYLQGAVNDLKDLLNECKEQKCDPPKTLRLYTLGKTVMGWMPVWVEIPMCSLDSDLENVYDVEEFDEYRKLEESIFAPEKRDSNFEWLWPHWH